MAVKCWGKDAILSRQEENLGAVEETREDEKSRRKKEIGEEKGPAACFFLGK